eukprot:TRINITY_DN15325_c0_g1_i1.p1 TRINITY_DN15325_c0_g1~~TRINITY_DN15325_c0_g1_i1.p1  ORF type:complete len:139 (-),score=39.80 TRINITY_DN15325_c0_g1_i1:137-553(-)
MNKSVFIVFFLVVFATVFVTSSPKKEDLDLDCLICTSVVTFFENQFEPLVNATEQEIQELIDDACSIFGPFKGTCERWVDNHIDPIIQGVQNNTQPEHLCEDMGACPVNAAETVEIMQKLPYVIDGMNKKREARLNKL